VRAVIELPEDTLLSLEPGQAVRLLLAAYPNQEFGTMEAILSSLNPVPVTSTSSPTPRARPPQAESR
jgi:hypothetical protein